MAGPQHPDLFSLNAGWTVPEGKLRVVIDAKVFYDLHERNTPECAYIAVSLLASDDEGTI